MSDSCFGFEQDICKEGKWAERETTTKNQSRVFGKMKLLMVNPLCANFQNYQVKPNKIRK